MRRNTRSGRFNPNRSGGPLPIEPTPLTLPCSRTTPIRWTPPNGANPPSAMQARKHNDGRRKRTSRPTPIGGTGTPAPPAPPPPTPRRRLLAADASPDDAWVQTPTNTFCPLTLTPKWAGYPAAQFAGRHRRQNPGAWAGSGVEWRRMGDSNPRGLAPNTLSKRAP